MEEKNKSKKHILKIFISIILFILTILIIFIIRNFIIISNLENIANKISNVNNYSYISISYIVEETTPKVTRTETYVKDGKFIIISNMYEGESKTKVCTLYNDGIDQIGIVEENGKKISTINGINSDIITISGSSFKLNELGIFSYDMLKSFKNIISMKILTDKIDSKEYYLIQMQDNYKYWIDKETGIVKRVMESNGSITEFNYEINNVIDNDIVKPEI